MMRHQRAIAVIGNANLDLVGGPISGWPEPGTETFLDQADSRIGGSAANTALVLQRLGAPSGLIAAAGRDLVGDMIADQFRCPLDRIARLAGPTSITFGLLHPGSERTFFSTPGHLDICDATQVRSGLADWPLDGAIALVSGSFAMPGLRTETSILLNELRAAGAQTAIDPGWPDGGWTMANRHTVLDWVSASDVILLNDKELAGLTGCADLEDGLTWLSPKLLPGAAVIVKCGPDGAMCRTGSRTFSAPSPRADIFDTIGAGDAFNAGYLAAWQAGFAIESCLHAGCDIASRVIRAFPRSSAPLSLPDLNQQALS